MTREEILEQCRHAEYVLRFFERCHQRAVAKREAEAEGLAEALEAENEKRRAQEARRP